MQFSAFGEKFTQHSGILQLMDDLGDALKSDKPVNMLGGGNPAKIAEVNAVFADVFSKLAAEHAVENIGNYSNPQGDAALIAALTKFLNREYGWNLTADNIALTNGSQNAFFYLFNLFGGKFNLSDGQMAEKAILLPLAPEYIGYADVHVEGQHFISVKPKIENVEHEGEAGFFKYRVDFDALESLPELKAGKIGAICCSRPTNPTGNVLTDDEMARLDALAQEHGIPLIIDNAYGMPFPNIIYSDVTLNWHENIIHKPEGAIFLWLWFENLPVSSQTLYEMLKAEGTLVIPGEHFFVGIDTQDYQHAGECIRMSIAQDAETLEKGIAAIGRVVRSLYDKK